MRVAALYDIHGNLPALEAVLADVRAARVDQIVVGGDVFPGPMACESLALLQSVDAPVLFIHGNGDREVLNLMRDQHTGGFPPSFLPVMDWALEQCSAREQRTIASWPATLRLMIDGIGSTLFCHATPRNDTDIFTSRTAEQKLLRIFDEPRAALVVCGHTHMQFDRVIGRTRVVNAGSVGMPFGDAGAYWLLVGPGVELRRTSYDLDAAAARIRATSYPQAESFAARNVLEPPSAAETLDALSHAELK